MAKAIVTLKDGTKHTFESVGDGDHLDFIYNYDESQHKHTIAKGTNSQRRNKAVDAIAAALNPDPEEGTPFYDGFTANSQVFIASSEIRSIELVD